MICLVSLSSSSANPFPHFGAQGFNLGTQASYLGAHPRAHGFNLCAQHARVDPGRKHNHDQAGRTEPESQASTIGLARSWMPPFYIRAVPCAPRGVNPRISISPPTRQDPEMDAILHNLAQQPMKLPSEPKNGDEREAKPAKPPATSHQPLATSHGGRKAAQPRFYIRRSARYSR